MREHTGWTRRKLLQGSALVAMTHPLAALAAILQASAPSTKNAAWPVGTRVYAARDSREQGAAGSLCVLQRQREGWLAVQQIVAESPRVAVLDARGDFLYVAHAGTQHTGVPTGRLAVYRVDRLTGRLTPHGQQPLALSAMQPCAIALAPQGDGLVVASENGVFSVLPVLPKGGLQPVSATRKDLPTAGAGTAMRMQFADDGSLAVTTGSTTRLFQCSHDGLRLQGTGLAGTAHALQSTAPFVADLPGLRCLAIADARYRFPV